MCLAWPSAGGDATAEVGFARPQLSPSPDLLQIPLGAGVNSAEQNKVFELGLGPPF